MPLSQQEQQMISLLSTRPVAYNPIIARACKSLNAGVLMGQLLYWFQKMNGEEFYKTIQEIEEETVLTRFEQELAIKKLKRLGLIEVSVKGTPPKRFFKINLLETYKLICGKLTNQFAGNSQIVYIQKITTEDILDNKLSNNAEPALEKKKFGNEEINFILEEFEKRWGFEPTDRMPRYAARALVMNFKKEFKLRSLEYSFDRFKNNFLRFIDWVMTQPWGEKIQKVDTLRLKFRIYKSPSKV